MNLIKIVMPPAGDAPHWVKEAWVGVQIPLIRAFDGNIVDVVSGKETKDVKGFHSAIAALRSKSPQAAIWWDVHFDFHTLQYLIFLRDTCEVIVTD